MRYYTLLLFAVSFAFAQPQIRENNPNISWASSVVEYSSELSPYQYSVEQVLGKPNVLPNPGDNPNAWLPQYPDTEEFIKVRFDNPIHIRQIAIAESYNPSAIREVYAYDTRDREYLIAELAPRAIPIEGRMLTIYLPDSTPYKIGGIKVVINGNAVEGYVGIDAIGISSSMDRIEAEVVVVENLKSELESNKMDKTINSTYRENRPIIAPDGKTLFFSRAYHPDNAGGEKDPNDIWYSEFDNNTGTWAESKNVGNVLNNKEDNYISSLTPDGNNMMVILGNEYKGNRVSPGVSTSTKTENGWTEPEKLKIINAYIETEDGDYFMANSRRTLIMAIDRYDSYGGKDIYVSFLQRSGEWSEPKNLGSKVNTAHDETSPYLAADDETLYFSSKGFSGFGGSDVYISRRLDNSWERWTDPENMGPDINTNADEISFNIPPSGKFAYFARGVGEDADIVQVEVPVFLQPSPVVAISGTVINNQTKEPLQARIVYKILPEGAEVGRASSDPETGQYEIILPYGSKYAYMAESEGFYGINDQIDLSGIGSYEEINKDLMLAPLEKGEKILLSSVQFEQEAEPATEPDQEEQKPKADKAKNEKEVEKPIEVSNNIYFNFAESSVSRASENELEQLVRILKENPTLKIEVAGHTDSVGSDEYNQYLSQVRAEIVVEYLIRRGVDKVRLRAKGYGENQPIASNDTPEGRFKNRRVEFEVIEY